jgi:hypothetical protein
MSKEKLIQAIAITAELCGRSLSEAALVAFADVLSEYEPEQVIKALEKCRQGLDGMFTLPAVISRIEDGRPGAEEAWTTIPRSEAETAVWTEDAQKAFFMGACDLLDSGDTIAARMAFKESYERVIREARASKTPCKWIVSQGWDVADRQKKVSEAVTLGRIGLAHAQQVFPLLDYKKSVGTSLQT